MALNIKDPETERLAAEAGALTGDSKTGIIRQALREFLWRHRPADISGRKRAQFMRVLHEHAEGLHWPGSQPRPASKCCPLPTTTHGLRWTRSLVSGRAAILLP